MKDEAAGVPNKEFVGLRSKMYSYHFDDKCKGVVREIVHFDDYLDTLHSKST